MSKQTISVTSPGPDDCRLPAWSGQYVLWIRWLKDREFLKIIADSLKVYRPGGYPGFDGFLYLLGMFCWSRSERKGRSLKAFDQACAFSKSGLAALAFVFHQNQPPVCTKTEPPADPTSRRNSRPFRRQQSGVSAKNTSGRWDHPPAAVRAA